MASKAVKALHLQPRQLNPAQIASKKYRPPNLVYVNRRRYPAPTNPRSLANAPSGIQLEHIRDKLALNGSNLNWICPLQKLIVRYCDLGGSSKGLRDFIVNELPKFARENPQVEVIVQPRPYHHPTLMSHYGTGLHPQQLCVRNLTAEEIKDKFEQILNEPGIQRMRFKQPVFSLATASESGLGNTWSPFREVQLEAGQRRAYPGHFYTN